MAKLSPGLYRASQEPDFVFEVTSDGGVNAYPTRSNTKFTPYSGSGSLQSVHINDIFETGKPTATSWTGSSKTSAQAIQEFTSKVGRAPYVNPAEGATDTPSPITQSNQQGLPKVGDLIPEEGGLRYEQEDIENLRSDNTFSPAGSSSSSQQQSLTGDPNLDTILSELRNFIEQLNKRGQVLNPNIEIDASRAAEFLKQAESEINPYYEKQLSLAREGLLRTAGFGRDEIIKKEQELERTYGKSLRQLGESAAEKGFALSGIRQQDERDLTESTQRDIESGRRSLEFNAGTLARTFAQQYGTPPTAPSFSAAPRALPGESRFQTSGSTAPVYELSNDVYNNLIGEQEFNRRGSIQQRRSQLEQADRTLQGLGQYRQLVF